MSALCFSASVVPLHVALQYYFQVTLDNPLCFWTVVLNLFASGTIF